MEKRKEKKVAIVCSYSRHELGFGANLRKWKWVIWVRYDVPWDQSKERQMSC